MAQFEFFYQCVEIWQTRSPNKDTNYASLALRVGSKKYGPEIIFLGDMSVHPQLHGVGLKIDADIPADGTTVALGWAMVNSSNGGDQLTNALGNAAIQLVGDAASAIPVVGDVISFAINALFDGFFRSHDGTCEAGNALMTGQQLNSLPHYRNHKIQHKTYGKNLPDPPGHKDSGDYTSTLFVYRPGEYNG